MKKILIYLYDELGDEIFDGSMRDDVNAPFIHLKKRLGAIGYDLRLLRNDNFTSDCEWVLFLNGGNFTDQRSQLRKTISGLMQSLKNGGRIEKRKDLLKECIKNGMGNRIALFLWEGQAVNLESYRKQLHSFFPIVFTWNDDLVDNKKYFKFYLPIPEQDYTTRSIHFNKKKLLVNISMNKKSSFPRELYSARKKAIFFFDKHYPSDFDLYGIGWEPYAGQLKSYRGKIQSKRDVLPYYKFCLAYENVQGEKGHITEKIFDAMRNGTVPIYWGASNITDYVDAGTFIDRRQFKSDAELAKFLSSMSENEYQKFIDSIRTYLAGERFLRFLPENFAKTIIRTLGLS